jgi:hypothetical protein
VRLSTPHARADAPGASVVFHIYTACLGYSETAMWEQIALEKSCLAPLLLRCTLPAVLLNLIDLRVRSMDFA